MREIRWSRAGDAFSLGAMDTITRTGPRLPAPDEMYRALVERDAAFDGIFFTGVRTTGIFCRTTCPAKKPARRNVTFFASTREALFAGYRPCLRCRPMEPAGQAPEWLRGLLAAVDAAPARRWREGDLRALGLDPGSVRRWFQARHGMTFHAYQRARRLALALGELREGAGVVPTAFEHGYESVSAFHEAFRRLVGTTPGRARQAAPLYLSRILTPLGPMLGAATDEGLCLLEFVDRPMLETQLKILARHLGGAAVPAPNAVLRQVEDELARYFAGTLREFTVPLATPGTPFQRRVWDALRTIPAGRTRSYAEQAAHLDSPSAVRAVARANGDNRIAIIIPCHRVVGSDGALTGYGGGLWRKRWLLDHEARPGAAELAA